MKLVLAEKPSVAKDIAMVIGATDSENGYYSGNGYIVSWAYGHLVTLAELADYDDKYKDWNSIPIIPNEWKLKRISSGKKQFKILKELLNSHDVDTVVEATDAGREGELIFRHIYNHARCNKPIERLWINSLTTEDIINGFNNLENGNSSKYNRLYECAFARQKADWLVGMNLTRLYSTMYNETLTIGRVQTPTLKMIVDREKEIQSFKKSNFYKLHFKNDEITADCDEEFSSQNDADVIIKALNSTAPVITDLTSEEKVETPPLPFDIASLQIQSNKSLGLSAKMTLDVAQNLYEKKLITYPRTDSRYINESMVHEVNEIINKLIEEFKCEDFIPNTRRIANDKKVSDHHAIIPTKNALSLKDDVKLSDSENKILNLIKRQTLLATAPTFDYNVITASFLCGEYEFNAVNKTVSQLGYKSIQSGDLKGFDENKVLKNLNINGTAGDVIFYHTVHETKPKQRYTDASIIKAMEVAGKIDFSHIEGLERAGLGTGATRADIIEKLIKVGYLERSKKQLVPTDKATKLFEVINSKVADVKLTANWEQTIADIKNGKASQYNFINSIEKYVKEVIMQDRNEKKEINFKDVKVVGTCPECGNDLIEKKGKYGKFNACSNYPECKYIQPSAKKEVKATDDICPDCGSPMVIRKGKYGEFEACSNYPECKYVAPSKKPRKKVKATDNVCPKCGATMVIRKGKYSEFEACSNYPECKYIAHDDKSKKEAEKTGEKCPECGSDMIFKDGRYGKFEACSNYPACKYIKK